MSKIDTTISMDALKASGFCTRCGNKSPCNCAPETKEVKGEFGAIVQKGIDQALALVREKFENQSDKNKELPFHNAKHSEGVIRNVENILSTIRTVDDKLVSEHDVEIGRLAAAYHDTVQDQEPESKKTVDVVGEDKFEKVERKRKAGSNEKNSGEEAEKFMNEANKNGVVFSEQDIQTVKRAIDTTVPNGFDGKTVVQTNLTKDNSLVERALALADLGTAGMEGPERYLEEGPDIFREEQLDILEAIRSGENIPENKQKYFKKRMVDWLKFQPTFARGRQERLAKELEAIPEPARTAVAKLFDKFEDSIQKAQQVADAAEGMSFEDLKKHFGY